MVFTIRTLVFWRTFEIAYIQDRIEALHTFEARRGEAECFVGNDTIQYNTIQCLMWSLHLAMVSMRPADMVSKIFGNAPASLQVSHNENKK